MIVPKSLACGNAHQTITQLVVAVTESHSVVTLRTKGRRTF